MRLLVFTRKGCKYLYDTLRFLRENLYENMFSRKKRLSVYCVTIIFIFTVAIYLPYFPGLRGTPPRWKSFKEKTSPVIRILLWTSPQNPPTEERLTRMRRIVDVMNNHSQSKSLCSEVEARISDGVRCQFSMNHENIREADALVFFMFTSGFKLSELPSRSDRKPDQLWVMYAREPPPYSAWVDPLVNLFNWTMSYRKDSDVWVPYGKKRSVNSINKELPVFIGNITLNEWIRGKSKLVAGVISRCQSSSKREALISEMNKTEQVDIFGGCGHSVCGRYSNNCSDFWRDLAKQYKFYLAFENSLCIDYVTEKFWRALELGMVPVVYGGGNYDIAAPHSNINVRDFNSTEEVMKYLKKLDGNVEEYSKYFDWRKVYTIQGNGGTSYDWCTLCSAIQEYKRKSRPIKTYQDLEWWWKHQPNSNISACKSHSNMSLVDSN